MLAGEQDFITGPAAAARHRRACLSDVRKVVIPGAGHFVFVEAPEEFRAAVLDFLGAVNEPIAAIRAGRPVVLPTDTVYGLCGDPELRGRRHARCRG